MIAITNDGPRPGVSLEDLDFRAARFPSDELSVRRLRGLQPELFDAGYQSGAQAQPKYFLRPEAPGHVTDRLGNLMYLERYAAARAYAAAAGIAPPEGEQEALLEELSELYVGFGLARGPQHAAQLIRAVESEGRKLSAARGPSGA